MAKLYRAEFVFPYFTGNATDVAMNTFHLVGADDSTKEEVLTWCGDHFVPNFYHVIYAIGTAGNRASYVNWQAAFMRVFDQSEPTPRIPVMQTMGYSNQGSFNTQCPTEVAMCLSFSAEPTPGIPSARLRGRVFLPSISNLTVPQAGSTTSFPLFSNAACGNVVDAFVNALEENTIGVAVAQYGMTGTSLKAARPIAEVWVDNSPDTQRRRGHDATFRDQDLGGPWGAWPA